MSRRYENYRKTVDCFRKAQNHDVIKINWVSSICLAEDIYLLFSCFPRIFINFAKLKQA